MEYLQKGSQKHTESKKLSSVRPHFTRLIVLKRRDSNFLGTLSGALADGDFVQPDATLATTDQDDLV